MEKNNVLRSSKTVGWIALIIVFSAIVLSMTIPGVKKDWWEMIDIFFFFMMAFSHLAALYLNKISVQASKTLDKIAFVFGILGIIALIVVYFITNFFMGA
ncbi:MAG: hypothetical protein K2L89_00550 [Muribaculaceae bacterium]|nr:hypothetical protein [Muribaculaceae bacterium]